MSDRFAVRVAALAFAAAFAFTTIAAQGTSNVKGIDVIIKKKPGNLIVVRGTTGPNGSVDVGNLPKGQYELTLALPKGAPARGITHDLEISGATAPGKASWNFETGRPFNPAASSTARAAVQDSVPFATDGQHHVVVVVSAQSTAVNSSRSNIKNNFQIYATPLPTPTPTREDQSTAVNSSRSNIKNNLQIYVTPSPSPTASPVGNAQSKSINLNSSRSNIYKIVVDPTGTLQCTVDGKSCTQDQVKVLAASLSTSKSIKSLSLAPNGTTLLCDNKPCTTAHLTVLNNAASAVNASSLAPSTR